MLNYLELYFNWFPICLSNCRNLVRIYSAASFDNQFLRVKSCLSINTLVNTIHSIFSLYAVLLLTPVLNASLCHPAENRGC